MPTRSARLAWAAAPVLVYLAILARLWSDAPTWDDYGILRTLLQMMDASPREWLSLVTAQHNEHRIGTVRLVARAAAALGPLDFRVLILLGNLAFLGAFLLMLEEFRERLEGPAVLAAALLMFQWSYYEASLWTSGGLTNMGAIFFSFAALAVSRRRSGTATAAAIVLGVLAAGCSASGLFALPLAALGCALGSRVRQAWVFAAAGALLWLLYFNGYVSPPNHPPPSVALTAPIATLKLFLLVVGGVIPNVNGAITFGAVILAAVVVLARRGAWSAHPTAILWLLYLLLSAAAAAVGRVGLGVYPASRYAIFSTCFIVLCVLGYHEISAPWRRRTSVIAVLAAAAASVAISWASWKDVRAFAFNGTLLAKPVPDSPDMSLAPFFGMYFPHAGSTEILVASEQRGLYATRHHPAIHPSSVRWLPEAPGGTRVAGHVDEVKLEGRRVSVRGWTDIPATQTGRVFTVFSRTSAPAATSASVVDRSDAARALLDARIVYGGFWLHLDYPAENLADDAARELCVLVEAPGEPAAMLTRRDAPCPAPSRVRR